MIHRTIGALAISIIGFSAMPAIATMKGISPNGPQQPSPAPQGGALKYGLPASLSQLPDLLKQRIASIPLSPLSPEEAEAIRNQALAMDVGAAKAAPAAPKNEDEWQDAFLRQVFTGKTAEDDARPKPTGSFEKRQDDFLRGFFGVDASVDATAPETPAEDQADAARERFEDARGQVGRIYQQFIATPGARISGYTPKP